MTARIEGLFLTPGAGSSACAGSTAGPFQPADRYRLDLESGGAVDLKVNGRTLVARAPRAASFVITSAGARPIAFAGPRCP